MPDRFSIFDIAKRHRSIPMLFTQRDIEKYMNPEYLSAELASLREENAALKARLKDLES